MHQVVEETEEIGDQQIADVQAIDVGVRGQDDFFIAQVFDVVLDVQTAHEIVHLVVFIDDVALEVPDIERLALEHEHRLVVHVAATGDGTGGGLLLGFGDHEVAVGDGVFVFAVGEAEIRSPNGGILASDLEDPVGVQVALIGEVVLTGEDALAGNVAQGFQEGTRFGRGVGIHRLALIGCGTASPRGSAESAAASAASSSAASA